MKDMARKLVNRFWAKAISRDKVEDLIELSLIQAADKGRSQGWDNAMRYLREHNIDVPEFEPENQ